MVREPEPPYGLAPAGTHRVSGEAEPRGRDFTPSAAVASPHALSRRQSCPIMGRKSYIWRGGERLALALSRQQSRAT